ncbi:MAG TPA: hypothetical protein VIL94_10315 [Acidothermaceae bacterium]|jgi:hypothetical protein
MRVEAGAVVDEFDLEGIGRVVARHARTKDDDGVVWACMFTVVATGNSDLAIVHRLSATSLAEARRSVRQAVEFLAGRAAAAPKNGGAVPNGGAVTNGPGIRRGDDPLTNAPSGRRPDRLPADHAPAPLS